MLSFRELSEKKTKVTINPKLDQLKEKKGCSKCEDTCGENCKCSCHDKEMDESAVPGKPAERLGAVTAIPKSERDAAAERLKAKAAAKRKAKGMEESWYDPMEDPDFDHDEAEKTRGQSGKPAKKKTKKTTKTEDVAYVSQEEVSEESNQSIAETETLLTFGDFIQERSVRMDRMKDRYLGNPKETAKRRAANVKNIRKGREEIASNIARLSNSPGGVPASVARQAEKVGVRKDHFKGAARAALKNSFEPEGEQLDEMPFQVMGSPDGKKEKKIGKPVKSKKYADARAAELADTHRATGGQYRSQYVEETELDEATRAAKEGKKDEHRVGVEIRAKQSAATLAAKRARQKVLDAHEKKTGKKLDISKTPEGKKHDQHFGGSRQTKNVKGAKETPLETHNRRVGRDTLRKLKHGKTSKEKKYDAAMAKHTSPRD
ncbi:hypothetical protein RW110999_191 [Cyanophage S-RIM4]|nr:hypothetical protein RW110999_191 [Cyanophage S-RIM4]